MPEHYHWNQREKRETETQTESKFFGFSENSVDPNK